MKVDRRRAERLVLPDEKVVVMGLHSNSVGVIRDISLGGMKFEYVSQTPVTEQWEMVDILANRQDQVLLASVPCKIAYDIKDLASNRSFTGACVRICGVCFRVLTQAQTAKLRKLLALQGFC